MSEKMWFAVCTTWIIKGDPLAVKKVSLIRATSKGEAFSIAANDLSDLNPLWLLWPTKGMTVDCGEEFIKIAKKSGKEKIDVTSIFTELMNTEMGKNHDEQ